ncbi:MAG: methyl-accepting chemotaxis protein [Candidatus Aenigmatarchaeota archaeon]
MIGLVNFNRPPANFKEAKDMLLRLEDMYRLASISEKDYAEKKKRCTEMIKNTKTNKDADSIENKKRESEKRDVKMFIESLEEQFKNGEINKEDYENIKNVNEDRLKELEKSLEVDSKKKDETEIKPKKKRGLFQRLFGGTKKPKKKEELAQNTPEEPTEEIRTEPYEELESQDVEIRLDGDTPRLVIEEPPKDDELVDMNDNAYENKEQEVGEENMAEEIKEEPKKEEKPKKKGFLKNIFGKKKKVLTKDEEPEKSQQKEDVAIEKTEENEIDSNSSRVGPDIPKEEEKAKKSEEETKEVKSEEVKRTEEKPAEKTPKVEEKKEEEKLDIDKIEEVTPEVIEKLAAQMAEDSGGVVETESPEDTEESMVLTDNKLSIEIEKLKVMLEAVKDSKKATDETIQNISESIGEIRSMVMQADANFKTTAADMEKLEDEVSGIKPKEITKKFNEMKEDKDKLELEKTTRKVEGSSNKVNEIYDMLKSIGGIENLIGLNSDIQKKLKDINEAIKYIQRIGTKTEKIFIDLSKGMEDSVMIKAKQEDFDDNMKNVLSSIDTLNIRLKEYVSKEDLDDFKEEVILIKKQIDEIKKVLPVADLKLPEELIKLRKEKEDIEMFLDSLETQAIQHKINKAEYEEMKRLNEKKLDGIRAKLEAQWKDIEIMLHPEAAKKEAVPIEPEPREQPKSEKAKSDEAKKKPKKVKKRERKKTKKKANGLEDQKKKILKDLKELKV